MKTVTCEKCNRSFLVPDSSTRLYCSCETVTRTNNLFSEHRRESRNREAKCRHRGAVIRGLNCGCDGNPQVYQCAIYGECARFMTSRMPEDEKKKLTFCNKCDRAEQ